MVEGEEECHDKIVETAIEVEALKTPEYEKRMENPILKMKTYLSGA